MLRNLSPPTAGTMSERFFIWEKTTKIATICVKYNLLWQVLVSIIPKRNWGRCFKMQKILAQNAIQVRTVENKRNR